jgi:mannose-6-phosphate isomerase-like protein (cupin superfamily)
MQTPNTLDRRTFSSFLVALAASGAGAQESHIVPAVPGPGPSAPKPPALPVLASGTFSPGPVNASNPQREGRRYVSGMLKAGNIQLEMHETVQVPGAQHEPVGTHKHNELWCVQRGTASLFINDVEHRMDAGDVGLVCAGDRHWIKNIGSTELAYFVITVGPPE